MQAARPRPVEAAMDDPVVDAVELIALSEDAHYELAGCAVIRMRIERTGEEHIRRLRAVQDLAQVRIQRASLVRRLGRNGGVEGDIRLAGVARAKRHVEVIEHESLNAAIGIAEYETILGRDAEPVRRHHGLADPPLAELAQTQSARTEALLHEARIELERVAPCHPHDAHA